MITALLVMGALTFLFWPSSKKGAAPALPSDLFTVPTLSAASSGPDPRHAIDSLLEVRDRLAASEQLDEEASQAVDTLWLDLLHGSRRK